MEMIHISVVEALSVTEQETRKQTHRDPILSRVLEVVQSVGGKQKLASSSSPPQK